MPDASRPIPAPMPSYPPDALKGLSVPAHASRAWPFEQARGLLKRIATLRIADPQAREPALREIAEGRAAQVVAAHPALAARPVVLETGYGPSGLPHIGTFQEVARTTMVRSAFVALTEALIPTQLICFSDDMDGLRKAPPGLPHQDWLEEDLDKPLTQVRDPFEEFDSFGAHNNARLRRFLDGFGFDYDFRSSTAELHVRRVRRDIAQGAGASSTPSRR